jgi:molecular chaperone Hsp33
MENDSLQRFVFEHAPVRGEIIHLDATWRAVLDRHEYPPALQTVLGEMMAAAALLSATLKFSGSLIMQIQGNGPIRLLVVECTSDMTLRAMAQWEGEVGPAPLAELIGAGRFVMIIDPRDGRQTYQGIVGTEGGSVAEILQNYMVRSEQLDTRLWLAADGRQAAGMLLQKMPGAGEDADAWNRASHLGATLTRKELLTLPASDIIRRLFHEEDIRVFDRSPVSFRCTCSRERVAGMLRMLGYGEVKSVIDEQGQVDVACEFCNRRYVFDPVDVEQLFASEVLTEAGRTRH